MNGYETAAVYTVEQLRGYFEDYHATARQGPTRMDRCDQEGFAARIQTADPRLREELGGAGFECDAVDDEGLEFLVATLEEGLATDYYRWSPAEAEL